MRSLRLTLLAVILAAGAGCSDTSSPTATVQPAPPRRDSSGMVGSGNRDGSTVDATSANDTTAATRSTGMVGSGN